MITRGLIIRQPWIGLILIGEKIWEMRSRPTKIRGRIALIEQGTGLIVGECEIVSSGKALQEWEKESYKSLHKVEDLSLLEKWCYPWEIGSVKKYKTPFSYNHPKGAVTWVNIENVKGLP